MYRQNHSVQTNKTEIPTMNHRKLLWTSKILRRIDNFGSFLALLLLRLRSATNEHRTSHRKWNFVCVFDVLDECKDDLFIAEIFTLKARVTFIFSHKSSLFEWLYLNLTPPTLVSQPCSCFNHKNSGFLPSSPFPHQIRKRRRQKKNAWTNVHDFAAGKMTSADDTAML